MLRTLLVLCVVLAGVALSVAQPVPKQAAAATVQDYYEWYLNELIHGREPVKEKPPELKKYVSSGMLAEIARRQKSPEGLEADPFIEAQDFTHDWVLNIATQQKGATTVVVTLGKVVVNRNRLQVEVRNEGGAWKIAKVVRLKE